MDKNIMILVGLVIGVIVGYSIGYVMCRPQISQLQSTLSDTQSDLSASQSEVQSLQGQLADAQINITSLETQLSQLQATMTSLENQLETNEIEYSTLSAEYDEFKSDVTSLANSLEKKMELESQIIQVWIAYERSDLLQFMQTITGLEPYVDAIGDPQLSTIHNEFLAYFNAEEYRYADEKFADLMERNSALIQTDLTELNTILDI
jgi:chromosome segregation ATPase